ncbi:hypothetical protein BT69DRAFT_1330556 [Atractiella rhizophila]|nr:hypothetical protein BT69DRAFT_1330556 [Atractiella rhizophila]
MLTMERLKEKDERAREKDEMSGKFFLIQDGERRSVEWERDKEAEDEVTERWEYMFIAQELKKDLKVEDNEERRVPTSCKLMQPTHHLPYPAPKARIDEVVGWSNILQKREMPVITPIENTISS